MSGLPSTTQPALMDFVTAIVSAIVVFPFARDPSALQRTDCCIAGSLEEQVIKRRLARASCTPKNIVARCWSYVFRSL